MLQQSLHYSVNTSHFDFQVLQATPWATLPGFS